MVAEGERADLACDASFVSILSAWEEMGLASRQN